MNKKLLTSIIQDLEASGFVQQEHPNVAFSSKKDDQLIPMNPWNYSKEHASLMEELIDVPYIDEAERKENRFWKTALVFQETVFCSGVFKDPIANMALVLLYVKESFQVSRDQLFSFIPSDNLELRNLMYIKI